MAPSAHLITQDQIQKAADYVRSKIEEHGPKAKIPKIAIVCGSGLSQLGDAIQNPLTIPYSDIPNFPTTSVSGHKNQMIIGVLSHTPVIIFQGRFHFYEGLTLEQCTMYVKLLNALDVEYLIVSNAAGGINPEYKAGDIMLLRDHVYMNGLTGIPLLPQDDTKGVMFENKKTIYDKKIIKKCEDVLREIAYEGNIHVGVYACLSGPNYETIAEVKLLKTFGVHAVGMSTVPEVLVAKQCGIQVVAFSLISNECIQDYDVTVEPNHAEVLEICAHRSESLKKFVEKLVDFLNCCCVCPDS